VTDATDGASTWERLRRRKVVQWGLAYVAAAWGLLQVLGFAADAFHWPDAAKQFAMLALAVGLPIVIVLAWYHGDRGQQRVGRTEIAIITLLLALAGGLFWRYHVAANTPSAATAQSAASPVSPSASLSATPIKAVDARSSIAVLPFENRSDQREDAFFVDGIHDDILTQLAKVSALKVISRTSVERFRETRLPLKDVAEQLGVGRIVEGGVQRAGKRVRITVQLIDTATDTHVWAESYDRELTAANIFAIQSDVATAIAAALQATLTSGEKASVGAVPTTNLDAWEAYQLGAQRMAKRNSEALTEAERFFRKAIALDPKFALAYVGLADTLELQVSYSGAPEEPAKVQAETALANAMKLDPNLAEAWASSASLAAANENYDRAEQMYLRAIQLNPNYATAHHWYGGFLAGRGRMGEALEQARLAVELDPLSPAANVSLGVRLADAGHLAEAEARFRRVVEIEPSMAAAYSNIAQLKAYALKQPAGAVPYLEKAIEVDPGSPEVRIWLAYVYMDLGLLDEAKRVLAAARQRWPRNIYVLRNLPYLHLFGGNMPATLEDARQSVAADARSSDIPLSLLRNADLRAGRPEVARARYAKVYPEYFAADLPKPADFSAYLGTDIALVLQATGEPQRAKALLDRVEPLIRPYPRLGPMSYGISEMQVLALRGQDREALALLRELVSTGWRGPMWRYYREFDPTFDRIRNEPEFKAAFADIERDMAVQRAKVTARPKDAPLDLTK
jgi:TolB-like protein/Flp pilus assembly protein TadD